MMVHKWSWRKILQIGKCDVFCTRLILSAVFPAAKSLRFAEFCEDNLVLQMSEQKGVQKYPGELEGKDEYV